MQFSLKNRTSKESNYSASKAGLLALTRQAAADYASFGIRINAIALGPCLVGSSGVLTNKVREGFAIRLKGY
jgi:NAD(P)-dependent dehydrogenase (short-subunit alcohol dehydrogenase family)